MLKEKASSILRSLNPFRFLVISCTYVFCMTLLQWLMWFKFDGREDLKSSKYGLGEENLQPDIYRKMPLVKANMVTKGKSNVKQVHSDPITSHFTELGIKLKKSSNLTLWNLMAKTGTGNNMNLLLRELERMTKKLVHAQSNDGIADRGALLADIVLEYPKFNRTLPHFVSSRDRELYLKVPQYTQILKPQEAVKLKGHIAMLYNGAVEERIDCGWINSISNFTDKPVRRLQQKPSSYIFLPLLVPDSFSFQHFYDGVMPKIAQIAPFLSCPNLKLILPHVRDKIIVEMLAELGIGPNKLLTLEAYEKLKEENNIAYQLNTCITPPIHPILWSQMRKLLNVQPNLSVPIQNASVILLTRAKSFNPGRNIQNIEEVKQYLYNRYKDKLIIFLGGYSFNKSKEIFGRARLVLGVHGGAFYNINLCPKQTVVAEYVPMDAKEKVACGLRHGCGISHVMSNLIGLRYYRLTEKPISQGRDIVVLIPKLKLLLDKVDALQNITLLK